MTRKSSTAGFAKGDRRLAMTQSVMLKFDASGRDVDLLAKAVSFRLDPKSHSGKKSSKWQSVERVLISNAKHASFSQDQARLSKLDASELEETRNSIILKRLSVLMRKEIWEASRDIIEIRSNGDDSNFETAILINIDEQCLAKDKFEREYAARVDAQDHLERYARDVISDTILPPLDELGIRLAEHSGILKSVDGRLHEVHNRIGLMETQIGMRFDQVLLAISTLGVDVEKKALVRDERVAKQLADLNEYLFQAMNTRGT